MKKIPNYISGKLVVDGDELIIEEKLIVYNATYWNIIAAIDNATKVQVELKNIPTNKIIKVLEKAMLFFNPSIEFISNILGSDKNFLIQSIKSTKQWCKNISKFYQKVIDTNNLYSPSSPTVCILPSNSEQEALFVISQILLSGNSAIIRPSSRGIGAYIALELIEAINKAIDQINDPQLKILKKAISIINTSSNSNYLDHLSVHDWNYIMFGSQHNLHEMKKKIPIIPRKIICYGTGLAMTIIWEDIDLDKYINEIADSITENGGNECVNTDIIYIHPSKYDEFITLFNKTANLKSKLKQSNIDFAVTNLKKKGLSQKLRFNNNLLLPTCIPITKYESAMEYPAPIVSLRKIENDLDELIKKDLKENMLKKNIATSIYTEYNFNILSKNCRAYIVKHNKPTHVVNLMLPHQGIYLLNELLNITYLEK